MSTSSPKRLDELDGLRGALALWVVISHMVCWSGFSQLPLSYSSAIAWTWFSEALPAVETFIILSGFAISFLMYSRPQSYPTYLTGRFFRIAPVYFVCLALGIVAVPITAWLLAHLPWKEAHYFSTIRFISANEQLQFQEHFVTHLTLLHGTLPQEILPASSCAFLPPAWSISLEWQYYLVAPLIAYLLRWPIGLLGIGILALIAEFHTESWKYPALAYFPAWMSLFLVGIGSFHLYRWFASRDLQPSQAYLFPVVGAIVAAILIDWHPVSLTIWAVVFGSLFVDGNDPIARVLKGIRQSLLCPRLQTLGKMSYSLYLIHWPLILFLMYTIVRLVPSIHPLSAFICLMVAGLPMILIGAWMLHRTVELPGMQMGKKLTK